MMRGFSWILAIALCAMLPNAICAQQTVGDAANPNYLGEDEAETLYQNFTSGASVADSLETAIYQIQEQAEEIDGLKSAVQHKVDPGHRQSTMKVLGRVHADVWTFPSNDAAIDELEGGLGDPGPQDRMGFRRLRLGARGYLPANMEYHLEMEFGGLIRSEFRDAWLGWNDLPVLQTLRIGNQKRPIGLDHWNSSNHNVFMERPFIIEGDNEDARRFGVMSWNSSQNLRWSWQYGVFNQRNIQNDGFYISDHWQLQGIGRLANTFWYDEASCGRGYGHWAIAGSWGDLADSPQIDPAPGFAGPQRSEARWRALPEGLSTNRWLNTGVINGANDFQELGLEGVLNFGALQIVGEYQSIFVNRDSGQSDLTFQGGYVYASYFLTGEHMVWDRTRNRLGRVVPFENFFHVRTCDGCIGRGLGAWQIAVRGSYADYSDDDIHGGIVARPSRSA